MEKEELISNFINRELVEVPNALNNNLIKNNQKLNIRNEFNEIKSNIDDFLNGYVSNRFTVIPGLRGVGKTTLLYQTYEYLLKEKNIPLSNILYISFDELNNIIETDIKEMTEIYINNKFNSSLRTLNQDVFLFIDECQYDSNWAKSGKIIYDKSKKIFMIFSGSSALNLEYNADAARRIKKKPLSPLNYAEHLKLKYGMDCTDMSNSIKEVIFTGKVENAIECEEKTFNEINNHIGYDFNDWDLYLKYGGFPILFDKKDPKEVFEELINIVEKIVTQDMTNIQNISKNNQATANRILRFLATQQAGEISQNNLANYFKTAIGNINTILDILEKTHLIFHIEAYGASSTRAKKSWKYYFATSSIRNALATSIGNTIKKLSEYEGILIENQIASNLFNLSNKEITPISIYYDSNKKQNVDFIIQENFESPIPLEVGRGDKKTKQIKYAINSYNSDYGIVVSKKTDQIKRKGNVIFIPIKTFSFL